MFESTTALKHPWPSTCYNSVLQVCQCGGVFEQAQGERRQIIPLQVPVSRNSHHTYSDKCELFPRFSHCALSTFAHSKPSFTCFIARVRSNTRGRPYPNSILQLFKRGIFVEYAQRKRRQAVVQQAPASRNSRRTRSDKCGLVVTFFSARSLHLLITIPHPSAPGHE